MKRVVKLIGLAAGCFAALTVSAQTGRNFGNDPTSCMRDLSLYEQDFKHSNYDAAIVNWRKVWSNCPLSSVNLVPRGVAMYQSFIAKELNQTKKKALIDTLMQVYEKGMTLRPEKKGEYLGAMAEYLFTNADSPENRDKILKLLEERINLEKEKTPAITYATYWRIVLEKNIAGQLSDEGLLENYTKISDYIGDAVTKTSNEELAKARDNIDESFATSNAASCENLLKIYGAKYEDIKDDAEMLRKLTRMLNRKECTDTELFAKASEQQYALNPSPAAAYNMAKLFFKKENFDKAVEYFEYAIKSETEPFEKANYNYQLGHIMLAKYNKYNDAKRYSLEASKLRPDWGQPYILLAQTYAAGSKCGDDDFEKGYVFWVVVDKLLKAKAVDPDCANQVNQMISQYSLLFPKKEEAFFRNITDGTPVNVGCWINENTKARFTN